MRSRISRAIAPGAIVAAVTVAGPMIEWALDHLVAGEQVGISLR